MFEKMVERQYELLRRERLAKGAEPANAPAEPTSAPVATGVPTPAPEDTSQSQSSEVRLSKFRKQGKTRPRFWFCIFKTKRLINHYLKIAAIGNL